MHIAWSEFTPALSLIGGASIGLAAAILLLGNGRVAGVAGIVAGAMKPAKSDWIWRMVFVAGLIGAPELYQLFATLPDFYFDASWSTVSIAGLLVGIGTRIGSGCTSGHGVCGLARLSVRSLIATLTFMASGVVTVFVVRHLLVS